MLLMVPARSFAVLLAALFPFFSYSKPLRARQSDAIAPNWNLSSISIDPRSSTVVDVAPSKAVKTDGRPAPILGTGTITAGGGKPKPTDENPPEEPPGDGPPKDTCGLCTVNIPQANVNSWFPATFSFPVGTLTQLKSNLTKSYATLVPESTTFDVTSTLNEGVAFTPTSFYDTAFNQTYTYLDLYTVIPSAAYTSVVTRTAALPLPSGNVVPIEDIPSYSVAPDSLPAASAAVIGASGTVFIATSTTPVLYFTAYEVETSVPTTLENGKIGYSTSTQTFRLNDTLAYPVRAKGLDTGPVVTGVVPDEFLQIIPQSSCCAGTFTAEVTVLVVVDLTYIRQTGPIGSPFLVHVESSVLGFEDPPTTSSEIVFEFPTKTPKSDTDAPLTSAADAPSSSATDSAVAKVHIESSASAFTDGRNNNGGDNRTPVPSASEPTQQNVGTVGSSAINVGPSSVVIVGSQTLTPGSAITVDGTPVSLVPSATAIVIGGTTSALPQLGANTQPPPIITVGSSTLTPNAATQFFIGPGQTLTPGGIATVGGTVVSLGPSASFLVVDGSTQVLSPATSVPQIVVGSSTIVASPGASSFVIGSQTLAPGQAITLPGSTVVSLAPGATNVVVNGVTAPVIIQPIAPAPTPVLTIGNTQVPAISGSTFIIASETLTPGGTVTVSGTTVALGPSASFAVINGITSTLAAPPNAAQITAPPVLTIGNIQVPAISGSTFIIASQTLTPGGTVTVFGTTVALGPSALFVVINGITSTLAAPPNAAQITAPPVLTIGNGVFTPLPGQQGTSYIIGGQTLTPGGTINVAGSSISLAPGASVLFINGNPTTLIAPNHPITNAPLLTINGATIIPLPGGGTVYTFGGQTLTPGGVVTVSGLTVSLSPGATLLVYGVGGQKTTETLFPATTTAGVSSGFFGVGTSVLSPGQTLTGGGPKQTGTGAAPKQTSSKGGVGRVSRPNGFAGVVMFWGTSILGLLELLFLG